DPLTDYFPLLTPYQYASCDPVTNIDIDGLEGCSAVTGMVGYVGNIGQAAGSLSSILSSVSKITSYLGMGSSLLKTGAGIYNAGVNVGIISAQVQGNVTLQVGEMQQINEEERDPDPKTKKG